MTKQFTLEKPLSCIFWSYRTNPFLEHFGLVVFAGLMIGLGAAYNPTFGRVTLDCQLAITLLVATAIGSEKSAYAVFSYLIAACLSIAPFPHTAEGFGALYAPYAGYLWGGMLGAFVTGYLIEKGWGASCWTCIIAVAIGVSIIEIVGWLWLSLYLGFANAYILGFLPYVYGLLVIVVILGIATPLFWRADC